MNRLTPFDNTTSRDADLAHYTLWCAWLGGMDDVQYYCVTSLADAIFLHRWNQP